MSIKIYIHYPHLRNLTNNQESVEVRGSTIGQCLEDLVEQFPEISEKIFDEHGDLLQFINIFHNDRSTHLDENPLRNPVNDGDEIGIILLIAGG